MILAGALCAFASWGCVYAAQSKVRPPKVPNPAARAAGQAARQANKAAKQVPAEQLRRLLDMPPEQREKALDNAKLSPQQRQRVQNQLDRLDSMPPQQRERQLNRMSRLEQMAPERRRAVTNQIQDMRGMTFQQRRAVLHSPDFNQQFSPEEQDLIRETYPNAAK